jgi:parvulin-like peptidyl-prolyl isomerase
LGCTLTSPQSATKTQLQLKNDKKKTATDVVDQNVSQPDRPIAEVGGSSIPLNEFQAIVRYRNIVYVQNYSQIVQYFGEDASFRQQYQNAIDNLGSSVQESLVEDRLIRQEAERRGIHVTTEEVDKAIQAELGYFPDGTPTPMGTDAPISSPMVVTPIATGVPTIVPGPTPTLLPTSTPFTLDAYQKIYQDYMKFYSSYQVTESDLRRIIESQLYRDKVQAALLADPQAIPNEQEYIWARHILVSSELSATEIINKLNQGEDFATLVGQYSIDTGTQTQGGDLGWFPRGQMVPEFEKAAFGLANIGDYTLQPVQSTYGYHVIQLLGRENRPFTSDAEKFQYWLKMQKQQVKISTSTGAELLKLLPAIIPLPPAPDQPAQVVPQVIVTPQVTETPKP